MLTHSLKSTFSCISYGRVECISVRSLGLSLRGAGVIGPFTSRGLCDVFPDEPIKERKVLAPS